MAHLKPLTDADGAIASDPLSACKCIRCRQRLAKSVWVNEGDLVDRFDVDVIASLRASRGLFRDLRVDVYGVVQTLDGRV